MEQSPSRNPPDNGKMDEKYTFGKTIPTPQNIINNGSRETLKTETHSLNGIVEPLNMHRSLDIFDNNKLDITSEENLISDPNELPSP